MTRKSLISISIIVSLQTVMCPIAFAKPINFSALKVQSSFQKGNEKITLQGEANVATGSIKIKSDQIEVIGSSQRYIRATGAVQIIDTEKNIAITAYSLNYDRETEVLKVQGSVVFEDFKEKVVVRCGSMEYRTKENFAIISTNVKILKEDLSASAQYATYNRDAASVTLSGLPEVKKKTDLYKASSITVNLKTNDIELHGSVTGSVEDAK